MSVTASNRAIIDGPGNFTEGDGASGLEVRSVGGQEAVMAFHRPGAQAIKMGLDSANRFVIGGWSWPYGRFFVEANGNVTAAGAIFAGASVQAAGNGLVTPLGGGNAYAFHWNGEAHIMIDGHAGWHQITNGASDGRLKDDIAPSTFDCLSAVAKMPLVQYRWKPQIGASQSEIVEPPSPMREREGEDTTPLIPVGFVAQHLCEVFPEGVHRGDDGASEHPHDRFTWSINATAMIACLVGAIQQLAARVEALEAARNA